MNYEILEIVVKVAATLFTMVLSLYIVPALKAFLIEKVGAAQAGDIISLVQTFVLAAEQMLKADDPTGEKRKAYVVEQLEALGVLVSEEVNAYIEAAVFSLGHSISFDTIPLEEVEEELDTEE